MHCQDNKLVDKTQVLKVEKRPSAELLFQSKCKWLMVLEHCEQPEVYTRLITHDHNDRSSVELGKKAQRLSNLVDLFVKGITMFEAWKNIAGAKGMPAV